MSQQTRLEPSLELTELRHRVEQVSDQSGAVINGIDRLYSGGSAGLANVVSLHVLIPS